MRASLTAQPATQVGAENAISRASRVLRARAAPQRGDRNSLASNNLLSCESLAPELLNSKLLDLVAASPGEIHRLSEGDLCRLADEAREFILENVQKTGGHLASNLGVVELTVALHASFDFPKDKIVWDVGHQSYVHKLLSGRKDAFATLRQLGGLSGFPKRSESQYDSFDTGHSSTAISAALGIARARDIIGQKHRVVAVVGDGALTGGMCYEAMNDAGSSSRRAPVDIIVVLNDNTMSISGNVGSMSEHLAKIRSAPGYFRLRESIHDGVERIPLVGRALAAIVSRFKNMVKYALLSGIVFEEMGFKYIGPVDGHDVRSLARIFSGVSRMRGPVLVHAVTRKGQGFSFAEDDPARFHAVMPVGTGHEGGSPPDLPLPVDLSKAFGDALGKLAVADKTVVAITAAMKVGTGLDGFARAHPKRFFDVGIAEQHAVTLAAGMALNGLRPVVAIYSTFLQRAYDQLLHDVCLQNAHVVFAVDRAGVAGHDGETHQGLYDIAFLRHMPNMVILAPSCAEELALMLRYAVLEAQGPIAIRYPHEAEPYASLARKLAALRQGPLPRLRPRLRPRPEELASLRLGRGEVVAAGDDITLVALGSILPVAAAAAALLAGAPGAAAHSSATPGASPMRYSVELISARFAKPIDGELIARSVAKTGLLVVVEDGCVQGGFGAAVLEMLAKRGVRCRSKLIGFPDEPIPHGGRDELLARYGLSADGVADAALRLLRYGIDADDGAGYAAGGAGFAAGGAGYTAGGAGYAAGGAGYAAGGAGFVAGGDEADGVDGGDVADSVDDVDGVDDADDADDADDVDGVDGVDDVDDACKGRALGAVGRLSG